jgi:hypothetical protein
MRVLKKRRVREELEVVNEYVKKHEEEIRMILLSYPVDEGMMGRIERLREWILLRERERENG